MFTGIIQSIGTLASITPGKLDLSAQIDAPDLNPSTQIAVGDSIAVNGICLTATRVTARGFWADVSKETLARTTLGQTPQGARLNLELALTPTSRLGGHLVSGHVDGVGVLSRRNQEGRSWRFEFESPEDLSHYIAQKGSICIDGISLTVNEVTQNRFCVNVVPHTLDVTTLGAAQEGQRVNLEVDLVARYLERLLLGRASPSTPSGVTMDFLKEHGFSA